MNAKLKTGLRLLLLLAAGFSVCCAICFLADHVFNGVLVRWFEETLLATEGSYYPAEGWGEVRTTIDWGLLKPALMGVFTAFTLLWLTILFFAAGAAAKRREKRIITEISQKLRLYMNSGADATELFPKNQAELAAQMSDIKAALLRNERRLQEEADRRSDLVAYLAHDLKTPLTSVIGYLSLLDEAPDMPPEQRKKYTRIALDKAYRLEKMTNEFFDITRYHLQQIVIQKESVDLYYMLVQLIDELHPVLSARGNRVVLKADEALTIFGDPDKLARVFNNVLKNAASYSRPDTEIVITAEEKESSVVVAFTNHGRAIPPDKLSAMFEKFTRLDEARTSGTGGAGLGLAIAKEIVSLHGGTISAESRGELVTITISLPSQ